jgi:hypothetical protein
MRLAIKNQYTSNQKTQKTMPTTVSAVPVPTFNTNISKASLMAPIGLRGWRKTTFGGSSAKHPGIRTADIERPGGAIYLGADASLCLTTTQGGIRVETHKYNYEAETKCTYDASNNRYVGANPVALVKKTASTILRPDYYVSTDAYHKARAIDPEQHQSFVKVPGQDYSIAPSTSATSGSQVFRMTSSYSSDKGCAKNNLTTFKPSNRPFQKNNAVISSARTARLQHNTLTRENKMFRNVYGLTLHSNYIPGATPPHTIKSITELKCNVANMALTKIRYANRSLFTKDVGCFKTCVCP